MGWLRRSERRRPERCPVCRKPDAIGSKPEGYTGLRSQDLKFAEDVARKGKYHNPMHCDGLNEFYQAQRREEMKRPPSS